MSGSTTFKCPESECPYGCCPSGECAPMPDGTCPGSGGINVIYRPIDLKFPIPWSRGVVRLTREVLVLTGVLMRLQLVDLTVVMITRFQVIMR